MISHTRVPGTSTATVESPGSVAESITGRNYLSWSQINSFRGCPMAFTFKYVRGEAPAFTSSNLLFGSAIHSAIQHYFERRLEGEASAIDDLVEAYRVGWHERMGGLGDVPVRYGKGEDAEKLLSVARGLLEAFLASPMADPPGDVVAIEEHLSGSVADDLPDLLAILDLAYLNDDGLHVTDFKTSRSKWSNAKVNESSEQLRLYRELARRLVDTDTPVHLHFGVLVKTKTPSAQQLDVPDASLPETSLADAIRPVWRAITLGIDFPSPSAMGCSGCAFKNRCPAHARPRK